MMTSRIAAALIGFLVLALLVVAGLFSLRWLVGAVPLPLASAPLVSLSPLATHYFVNDLVGFDGTDPALPAAYVISHSARSAALVARDGAARLQWADGYGVSQDPLLHGWGGTRELTARRGALQLDYLQTMVIGRFNVDPSAEVELDIDMPWHARFIDRGDLQVKWLEQSAESTRLTLRLHGTGQFQLEALPPPSDGFPVQFEVRNLLPSEIAVGGDGLSPGSSRFALHTRDLHSLALGEIDGDGGAEFSVVRGGLRGRLADKGWRAQDLLYDAGDRREIGNNYPGFDKRGCPGRQSAWVDVDRDQHLELYVVCGRAEGDSAGFSNQLFRFENGDAHDIAVSVGLDLEGTGSFRFVDWDDDGWQDLFWVDAGGDIVLYKNDQGRFGEASRLQGRRFATHQVPQLLLSDVNGDRQPDIFIVHHEGNQLVINEGGGLRLEDAPTRRGLPLASLAGSWIDVDLDGYIDFLAVDSGLYLGRGKGRFLTAQSVPDRLQSKFFPMARVVNVEVEGQRQLLVAVNRCLPGRLCNWQRNWLSGSRNVAALAFLQQSLGLLELDEWELLLLDRAENSSSHREVKLSITGPSWNPHAIGAHVDIRGSGRHWVGETESSHFSQGSFAIYAAVEKAQRITAIVSWGDSCTDEVLMPAETSVWKITYPQRCMDSSELEGRIDNVPL